MHDEDVRLMLAFRAGDDAAFDALSWNVYRSERFPSIYPEGERVKSGSISTL